jgi:hypothetical protein
VSEKKGKGRGAKREGRPGRGKAGFEETSLHRGPPGGKDSPPAVCGMGWVGDHAKGRRETHRTPFARRANLRAVRNLTRQEAHHRSVVDHAKGRSENHRTPFARRASMRANLRGSRASSEQKPIIGRLLIMRREEEKPIARLSPVGRVCVQSREDGEPLPDKSPSSVGGSRGSFRRKKRERSPVVRPQGPRRVYFLASPKRLNRFIMVRFSRSRGAKCSNISSGSEATVRATCFTSRGQPTRTLRGHRMLPVTAGQNPFSERPLPRIRSRLFVSVPERSISGTSVARLTTGSKTSSFAASIPCSRVYLPDRKSP